MHDSHFAVVVGINRYPGLGDLRGPEGDAARFAEWLTDPAGGAVPDANVVRVRAADLPAPPAVEDATPTTTEIIAALRKVNRAVLARTTADPGGWARTRLYLFLAGHGILPEDSDAAALLAANASDDELGHNIDLGLYKRWYLRSGYFREIVLFADCCRRLAPGAVGFGPPFTKPQGDGRDVRTVVGYGTRFGRPAYEDHFAGDSPDERRGYLTAALLNGLRQAGTRERPTLTWDQLRASINTTLPVLAASRGRQQHAQLDGDDEVVFGPPAGAVHGGEARYRTSISFPDGLAATVDLLGGDLQVVDGWDTRDGKWLKTLKPGLYCVVLRGTHEPIGGGFAVTGADVDVHL